MTRDEHVEACKRRALKICDTGNLVEALTAMCSDLTKHEETKNHVGIDIGLRLMMIGRLSTQDEMRKFILGFH